MLARRQGLQNQRPVQMALRENGHGIDVAPFQNLLEIRDNFHRKLFRILFRPLGDQIADIDFFDQRMQFEQRHEILCEIAAADERDIQFSTHAIPYYI